jgi:hypothetical protein
VLASLGLGGLRLAGHRPLRPRRGRPCALRLTRSRKSRHPAAPPPPPFGAQDRIKAVIQAQDEVLNQKIAAECGAVRDDTAHKLALQVRPLRRGRAGRSGIAAGSVLTSYAGGCWRCQPGWPLPCPRARLSLAFPHPHPHPPTPIPFALFHNAPLRPPLPPLLPLSSQVAENKRMQAQLSKAAADIARLTRLAESLALRVQILEAHTGVHA